MVSLRRRQLMGQPNFIEKYWDPQSSDGKTTDQGNVVQLSNSLSSESMPIRQLLEGRINERGKDSPEIQRSLSDFEQPSLPRSFSDKRVKQRKHYKRKLKLKNQETCEMRGAYLKNMKWQAAIKVEKKQIHLGTVNSMEEAARLYDRAAFICGREPNYELPEEEKEELRKLGWNDFLALTRQAIMDKKQKRTQSPGAHQRSRC